MTIVRIDDPTDERVRDYFGLTDVALRRILEPAEGLYLAESEKVIRRALAAGARQSTTSGSYSSSRTPRRPM